MGDDQIVALGLLTRRDLDMLGAGFRRAFPIEDASGFEALLVQIDRADADRADAAARLCPLDQPPLSA